MGNITDSINGFGFEYDAAGRLARIEKTSDNFVENLYNGKGERSFSLRKVSSTEQFVEYYTYAEDGRLLTFVQIEQDPADSSLGVRTVFNYVWLDNIPVAQFMDQYQSDGTYAGTQLTYLHADHLATPRIGTGLTTSVSPSVDDAVVWSILTTAYGSAYALSDPDADLSAVSVALRFPGQVYYGIGPYMYNYYRSYDPSTGRYLESDPIGLQGGLNTYGYALGNPLRYIDRFGLDVTATFDLSTGELVVTDNDTGVSATANAYSGDESLGYSPAPPGTYSISDFPWGLSALDHYFAILRHDRVLDDFADGFESNYSCEKEKCTMGHLRLHAGYASHGCVTVEGPPDSDDWSPIQEILDNTRLGSPIEIRGESFPNYGILTITE